MFYVSEDGGGGGEMQGGRVGQHAHAQQAMRVPGGTEGERGGGGSKMCRFGEVCRGREGGGVMPPNLGIYDPTTSSRPGTTSAWF